LAACAALLLLPDGAQQGMRNTFMSYHWLTQISPSATYGLALLAVAWLFVTAGVHAGNRLQLLAGWLLAGILAFYKLHFFIASALLLWLVPPLFFRVDRVGLAKRALWAVVAVVVYGVTIMAVRKVPGVPLIRFDGSGIGEIFKLVKGFTPPGALRDFLADRIGTGHPLLSNLLIGVPFVLLASARAFRAVAGDSGHPPAQAHSFAARALPVPAHSQLPGYVPGAGARLQQEHTRRALAPPGHGDVLWCRGVGRWGGRPVADRVPTPRPYRPTSADLPGCSADGRPGVLRIGRPAHVVHAQCSLLSESPSASFEPPNTCATTAARETSSRIHSSIGRTPWLPCRSEERTLRAR
jgi:hypothetical protein